MPQYRSKPVIEPSGTLDSVYSTTNNYNFSTSDSKSVANSFYVGGEMSWRTSEGLIFGSGIEYQFYRKAEGADNSFNFVPVYGLLRKDFQTSPKNRAFVFGRLARGLTIKNYKACRGSAGFCFEFSKVKMKFEV